MNQMNDKTGSMEKKTSKLSNDSCELYDALRQGQTLTARRDSINNLIYSSQQEAVKIVNAGIYFMGFEFQFWSEACQDNSDLKRDKLMAKAAQEFLLQVQEFFPDNDMSPDPAAQPDSKPYSKDNLRSALNALSVTMHELNPKQEVRAATDPNFESYSMLDIIEKGLDAKAALNSGQIVRGTEPQYVKEVLLQEKYAVAVLQARYNMAVAVVLDGISKIRGGFFNKIKMFLSPWNADFSGLNMAQLAEYQVYVNWAKETHDFLQSHGYTPIMNKNFRKVLKNMRYEPSQTRSTLLQNEEIRLYELIQQYANEN